MIVIVLQPQVTGVDKANQLNITELNYYVEKCHLLCFIITAQLGAVMYTVAQKTS